MMEYTVLAVSAGINFGTVGVEEILQNVRTILATPKGSVPMDRSFGLDMSMLDAPLPIARIKMTAAIMEAVRQNEPRAQVTKVEYEEDHMTGRLLPKVKVMIVE